MRHILHVAALIFALALPAAAFAANTAEGDCPCCPGCPGC